MHERVQAGPRGCGRLRDGDRRARPRRRRAALPRGRHRGSRRHGAVREGVGPPRRRRARARSPPGRTVRGPRSHRQCSVGPAGCDSGPRRRVGSRSADRHHRRAGARRSGATVGDDDLDRRAVGPLCRRIPDARRSGASSRRGRPRPSASCSSGAGRPIPGTSRRSTRTGLHRRARAQRIDVHRARRRLDRCRLRGVARVCRRCALGAAPRRCACARPADARRSGRGRLDRGVRERAARLRATG